MTRRLLLLLGVSGALAVAGNAVSPRGLAWTDPLGGGMRARAARAGLVVVDLPAVRRLVARREAHFFDARPREEFAIGRIPRAVAMPWADLEGKPVPVQVPREQPIVVYCGNEFCESALLLGDALRREGYRNVAVFVDGYEAWWNAKEHVDQD